MYLSNIYSTYKIIAFYVCVHWELKWCFSTCEYSNALPVTACEVNRISLLWFAGGYNHLRSPVCQDESQRDETSPPPHSHSTQPPTSHSSTPNSNNNNNNNNANNAYIHLRNLNQLKTECEYIPRLHHTFIWFLSIKFLFYQTIPSIFHSRVSPSYRDAILLNISLGVYAMYKWRRKKYI